MNSESFGVGKNEKLKKQLEIIFHQREEAEKTLKHLQTLERELKFRIQGGLVG